MKPKIALLVGIVAAGGIGGCVAYLTFIRGTTEGADFIAEIKSAHVQAANVRSVRILVPPVGHTPFSRKELDSLECKAEISSGTKIRDLVSALEQGSRKRIVQNHPVTDYNGYWQIDISDGSTFYLYVDLLRDSAGGVCYVAASRRNATNPNGAERYVIDDFRSLFRAVGVEI